MVTAVLVHHKMISPLIDNQPPPQGVDADPRAFCPVLLHGEKVQGFMTTTFVPEGTIDEPFAHDYQTAEQIRLRLYVSLPFGSTS